MAIDGRVHESLRRRLSAARPLVIDGGHDLDGCWALDRCEDAFGSPTVVQQVLVDVRSIPEQRATMAIAARMAEHLQRYRWPADLVVSPVPSKDPVVELLARAVAVHLEVPFVPLLRVRLAVLSPARTTEVAGRIAARARVVPAHVLLIDDRVSSGRTLRACGSVLRARGAQAVWAMVAAADVRTDPSLGASGPGAASDDDVRQRGDFSDVWSDATEMDEPSDENAPVEETPTEETPTEEAAVEEAPVEEAPVEEAPVEEAPVEEAPVEEAPVEDAALEEAPVEDAAVEDVAVEDVAVEDVAVEDLAMEEQPVGDVVADEVREDETAVDEISADEITADEISADETAQDDPHEDVASDDAIASARLHPRRAKRRNRRAHKR